MAAINIEIQPTVEPILLADMKNWLRVEFTDDDTLIAGLITGARELVEGFTARSLVNKGYVQTLDSFPYFTDTVMSQMAYPPSYYSLPRYSTTLWNYSQMIKLMVSPLVSVTNIVYFSNTDSQYHSLLPANPPWYPNVAILQGTQMVDGNGNSIQALNGGTSGFNPPTWNSTLSGTTLDNSGANQITWENLGPAPLNEVLAGGDAASTFFVDLQNEPPRIFPGPAGAFWPSVLYVPNAVQIHFIAGYGNAVVSGSPATLAPPPLIPSRCITAMHQLVAGWYEHREAISPLTMKEMPNHVKALLWNVRVLDMQPTRG